MRETSQAMNASFSAMEQVITRILDGSSAMAQTTDQVDRQCSEFVATLSDMSAFTVILSPWAGTWIFWYPMLNSVC